MDGRKGRGTKEGGTLFFVTKRH